MSVYFAVLLFLCSGFFAELVRNGVSENTDAQCGQYFLLTQFRVPSGREKNYMSVFLVPISTRNVSGKKSDNVLRVSDKH